MPAHRTQNSRHLRVEAAPSVGAPPINIISPTPRTFMFPATETNNADGDVPYSYTSQIHASHSLPNLFAFDASSHNGADSSWMDAQSSTGSQTSMFSSYTDSPSSFTGSSFASPANSLYGSSYASSPPDSSSTPPLSLSPSPPPPSGSSADGDHQLTSSSPAPYPHPLPPHSNGQVRTQPPRPPNPWICFRNVRSAQYKSTGEFPKLEKKGRGCSAPSSPAAGPIGLDGEARRPRQADLSKHISLEWKALTDEEKAPYVRMSEEAKIVHARVYPGYKYQPRRKLDGADSAKKNAKAKKSGKKSSKSARRPTAGGEQQFAGGAVAIQLPVNDTDITPQGQDDNGEQSKEWTWLPDQTLLPFSWDLDQDGSAAMDDVMHQLDANVEEQGEGNENLFREPFYLSFPPLDPASEEAAPFLSLQELQGESTTFADPNYNFPNSSALGLQAGFIEDHSGVSEPLEPAAPTSFESGLRRDSLVNPYPDVSSESTGTHDEPDQGNVASVAQPQHFVQDMFTSLPQFNARAPHPARRGSVPTYSHATSPDGLLRPPHISQPRSQGRSRRSSVPTLRSSPPASGNDMRSIPTSNSNFGANNGITTSILIPKVMQRYDMELERDLADYNQAVRSMDPPAAKSLPPTPSASSDNDAGMGFLGGEDDSEAGLPLGFDFDAEFGDIIDINASRERQT